MYICMYIYMYMYIYIYVYIYIYIKSNYFEFNPKKYFIIYYDKFSYVNIYFPNYELGINNNKRQKLHRKCVA